MPHPGFKQSAKQRRRIARSLAEYHARVKYALQQYRPPAHVKMKGTKPREKPDPTPTPIPPSASQISVPAFEKWGLYSWHAEGEYFFKREDAPTYPTLQHLARVQDFPLPMWCYVKSAHSPDDLFMPIRIPKDTVRTLGHRWQPFSYRKKPVRKKKS